MAWSPELEFGGHDWRGYNEAMLVFILALGSPTFPAADQHLGCLDLRLLPPWGTLEGQTHLTFGPMFGHQYTHIWIDLRGIKDEFMWPLGMDYFENSRRAVLAQRAYAIRNPDGLAWLRTQHLGTHGLATDPEITSSPISGRSASSTRTRRAASACTKSSMTAPSRPPRRSARCPSRPRW